MANIQDKVVTVGSLEALHTYNTNTYATTESVEKSLTDIEESLKTKFDTPTNSIIPISNGGTGSSNGATGLNSLFAAGATILSDNQYGDTLPTAGTKGRIFFKKLSE